MNLTLGTLASLKTWLLPESERSGTEWDSAIAAIGKGVALGMQRHCNRQFARAVADTYECSADRAHVVLPRYPVEAVTKIEIRRSMTEGWVELTDVIVQQNLAAGFLLFSSDLGGYDERLRITYTGGYWLDASADAPSWQRGSAELLADAEEIAVSFGRDLAGLPAVSLFVVPPTGGQIIAAAATNVTVSGFTARLGAAVPAAGYKLQWQASLPDNSQRIALAAGEVAHAVAFAVPFASVPAVDLFIVPPDGGEIIAAVAAGISAEGFTAHFGAAIPAAGYLLQWIAHVPDAGASAALSPGAEELAVVFPDSFPGVPTVTVSVLRPSGGQIIAAVPAEITADGFTARLGAAIPGAGYLLQWTATLPVTETQPEGATAVPDDLKHIWLQQCAHVWRQKDKLGSALASNNGEAAASSFALAEGLHELLHGFRRYSMT